MNNLKIQITKSWRKTLSMRFDKHWVLQVKAPKFVLRPQIDAFISKNKSWIEKHSSEIQERQQNKKYYFIGEELDISDIKDLEKYYKQEAKSYIVTRCNELAEEYWFTHKWIRINSATTRWGSCSSKKTLNFSYRLIMSPSDCIDYVIIHELCHLRQMNHSYKFWWEVATIMPEYKKYEKHLKQDGWKYRL